MVGHPIRSDFDEWPKLGNGILNGSVNSTFRNTPTPVIRSGVCRTVLFRQVNLAHVPLGPCDCDAANHCDRSVNPILKQAPSQLVLRAIRLAHSSFSKLLSIPIPGRHERCYRLPDVGSVWFWDFAFKSKQDRSNRKTTAGPPQRVNTHECVHFPLSKSVSAPNQKFR